jgi:CRISPR/Cas system-associated exonuclease Cas4 (RecB family)
MKTPNSIIGPYGRSGSGHFDPKEFIQKYEEVYKSSSNRSGFKTKKTFSPSTLGWSHGTCPRYWFIAFSGAEFVEDVDSKAQANMDNGSYAHERIQKTMKEMGIVKEIELEIKSDDPPIRGFVDVVVDWYGKDVPGEIKTANDSSFNFRTTSGKPSPSHYVQFLIYLKVLKAEEGFLMYENKNTQEVLIIPVSANSKTKKDVAYLFEWMKDTRKAFDDGVLPEKPWTRSNAKICKTCPVRGDCFDPEKFGEGTVSLPPLEIPKP